MAPVPESLPGNECLMMAAMWLGPIIEDLSVESSRCNTVLEIQKFQILEHFEFFGLEMLIL